MTTRPRLTQDEADLINEYRGVKEAAKEAGINIKDCKTRMA